MGLRKLKPDEQNERDELDKLRDRFMIFFEGLGWLV